jgi:hypothetical protein
MSKTTVDRRPLPLDPAAFQTHPAAQGRGQLGSGQTMVKVLTGIAFPILLTVMVLSMPLASAQGNRSNNTAPVLHYDPPANFMRSAIYPPEDYLSTQFNASIQVYPFEPFSGNVAETFQRTLFRDRIDPRHREENVAGAPQFGRGEMPGAQVVFHANFTENIVGILRPHMRMVIVAGGSVAIVDVSAISTSLWARLTPPVNGMVHSMRVDMASAPPSLTEGPGPAGQLIAGLYRGTKQKFMTGLTFQSSYYMPALHFYLFSKTGRVYRAYDQIRAPGGDINRFDFDFAQRSDPANSGRYTIMDDKLYIKIGRDPAIVTAAPKDNTVTIESVTYVRL